MGKEKEVKFFGRIQRCVFNSESFKVYSVDVDKEKYPEIKHTKYGTVSITGELPDLTLGVEYEIGGIETESKNGISYKVLNIKRDLPTTQEDIYLFLSEILTANQANVLYDNYPDIVQRVKENRLDDVDLSKLKGIKEYTFERIVKKIEENFVLADLVIEFQGYLNLTIIRKIYNKYTSIEVLKKKLSEDPYKCLCGLAGVGFKTADSLLLDMEKASLDNIAKGKKPIIEFETSLKESPQRCLACILFILEDNENNGHTKMNLVDLRKLVIETVPACADNFVEVIKDDSIYFSKETMDVALVKTYKTEQYIADTILQYVNSKENVWEFKTDKYRNLNGFNLSDEQMNILDIVCKNTLSILNGAGGCVDCDTEYFNGTEWKPISDFKDGEKVLQYNEDGTANLVYPILYIKNNAEYLWHFETKYGLDQCLSENHRVVYQTSRGNLKIKTFKEIMDNHNNGNGFRGKFYTSFNYSGSGIDLSDEEIRLMIAIFADGTFQNDGVHCKMNLKKQRKKDRLEWLLNLNNIEFKKCSSSVEGYNKYWFDAPFNSKHFPTEWYNCNKHQLKIIADEVMYWDGLYEKHNCYSTTNKADADFIQFVYSSLNYRTSIIVDDRVGEKYITCGKEYNRKSIGYIVTYAKTNTVGLHSDARRPKSKTKIEKYKTKDGYEYCFNVPSHMLVLRRNNKIFITGNCGKTFSTQAIINMLKDHNKSFKLMSPTGKAAKVLSENTNEIATTIHRGLGFTPDGWMFNRDNKLKCDIVIIDEFSMVDIWLFKNVLDAIDFTETKLLMIGDNAQLTSVGCGNLLHDFMESRIIPISTLTKVFRYGEGGLMKVATDTRFCKPYLSNNMKSSVTTFGDNKDYTFVDLASEVIPQNAVALYKKLMAKGYTINDIQVLTSKNVGECGTTTLNNMIQKVANKNYGSTVCMKYGEVTYYEGDLIIQKVNNYKAERDWNSLTAEEQNYYDSMDELPTAFVANGETGIIKEIYNTYMLIDFDGIIIKYTKADLSCIGLGYSITIHKSQGSSIKAVILLTPQSHTFMLNSNLIYVGLTRMKEVCYHLGTLTSVNQAVVKKANLTRHTFMQYMLNKNNKQLDK